MKKPLKLMVLSAAVVLLVGLVGGLAVFGYVSATLPKIITTADYRPPIPSQVVMKEGSSERVIAEFYKERRYIVAADRFPKVVVDSFLAAEDDRFFQHQGISWISIGRAAVSNFLAGHVVQGGSTITQQVVKSLFLTPERNLIRKAKEAILAGRLEKNLTKQQILFLYLNQIYLGHGAYGIQAAAKGYFNKNAEDLTLPEAALLAGMPRAPGRCSPLQNPKCAKERQTHVLKRLNELGWINKDQMEKALATPLRVYLPSEPEEKSAAYLIEYVRSHLLEKYGEKTTYEEGLRVEVPSQLSAYQTAESSLRDGLRQMDKRKGYRGPIKKLPTSPEVDAFLRSEREALIRKRAAYEVLGADGQLDPKEVEREAGITSDDQLVTIDEVHQVVVHHIDDKKKTLYTSLGNLEVEIPSTGLAWITLGKEGKTGALSKNFSVGDVLWAKLTKKTNKTTFLAELEQDPMMQGALLSLEARTGYVLAMIGGYDHEKSEFNRAIQAQRQAGSAFKPIIYAAGLENGFTPASIIVDAPLVYDDEENGKWKPSNYEDKFYGDISYRQALIKSMNIPTIKIVQTMKVPTVINYAKRLGLTTEFKPDLSISLGSANFSLLELTQAYALFPRLGRKLTPIFIQRILDRDGKVLEENIPPPLPAWVTSPDAIGLMPNLPGIGPLARAAEKAAATPVPLNPVFVAGASPAPTGAVMTDGSGYPLPNDPDQVLDPRIAYIMTYLMQEVVEFGTGEKAKALGRPIAGKTGTTNDYRDAWFMGFTPTVVTGTWLGFDDQQTLGFGETGSNAAIPIWLGFMKEAVKNYPPDEFVMPRGVAFAWIDQATGKLTTAGAPGAVREAFLEGTAPTETVGQNSTDHGSNSEFLKEELE